MLNITMHSILVFRYDGIHLCYTLSGCLQI
jgi:hypothetical protein